jgi:predicted HicB family RNase H-like nuclease
MTENSKEKPPAPPSRLVATRLPRELAVLVRREAEREMISVAAYVRQALAARVDEQQRKV